jgi:tyrosyl-tRNA synthetase
MDVEERLARVVRGTAEVLTPEELRALFERSEHPRAYIGFEPSGALTVAHLIPARKVLDLAEAGCDVTVFLADWHAWINDKLGGDLERIGAAGRTMEAGFTALGAGGPRVRFRWAHELVGRTEYWSRVVRVARATTLARSKRAMSILGRSEEEANLDTAKLFYPSMQAADIFELPVDLAYGGLDQRRAHVLAREVAHHYGWPVPAAIHTPLLSSLKGGGRMDPTEAVSERKMSKSDPASAIYLAALGAAFCPAREVDGNPIVEAVRFIVFPWEGRCVVERAPKHGGPATFDAPESFLAAWKAGDLHPEDVKRAVAAALDRLVEPVRRYYADHPEVAPSAFRAHR